MKKIKNISLFWLLFYIMSTYLFSLAIYDAYLDFIHKNYTVAFLLVGIIAILIFGIIILKHYTKIFKND